jgi:uncharacterized protein (DUF2336 family)
MKFTLNLMSELQDALKSGAPERRVQLLRRITDHFLNESARLSEEQVGVFDDILTHLADRIEARVLAQLSLQLAPVGNAPLNMIRCLAEDDNISVAGPVLEQSSRISERDLIDIAMQKGQAHLLAISGRASLSEALTDVLVNRGDGRVMGKLARNEGARFSSSGFAALVLRADGDDGLTESLGLRRDIPLDLLKELLLRATNLVRSRLLAGATPEQQKLIQQAMTRVAEELELNTAAAEGTVQRLNREGRLNEKTFFGFVLQRQFSEMTAALALFCAVSADAIRRQVEDADGIMLVCKTARLGWPTVEALLQSGYCSRAYGEADIDAAERVYLSMSEADARRKLHTAPAGRSAAQAR